MTFNDFAKKTGIITCAAFLFFLFARPSPGWNQSTHRQINLEAVRLFQTRSAGKEKFLLGPLAKEGLSEKLRGAAVASSSLLASDFRSEEAEMSALRWISNAGDWADEPHLYSSVRHSTTPLPCRGSLPYGPERVSRPLRQPCH